MIKSQVLAIVQQLTGLRDAVDALYQSAPRDSAEEYSLETVRDDLINAYDSAHMLLRTYG